MYFSIYNNPQDVSIEEWQRDFSLLPRWRQAKALSYKFLIDKVLCTKAYIMLKEGLKKEYSIDIDPEFEYKVNGKPIIKTHSEIHFNLSHCPKGVLCVIDRKEIGCDIEEIPDVLDLELLHHCMNDSELAMILTSDKPCREFTRLWTIKEALLKYTGEGLSDNLHNLLIDNPLLKSVDIHSQVKESKGYVYSIITSQ